MQANVSEIFYSAQGEGKYIGVAQVFIRFSGCPYDCPYCDTDILHKEYFMVNNNKYKNPVTVDELYNIIIKEFGEGSNFHSFSITGGEPLINYEFIKELAEKLRANTKAKLFLETSGLITKYFKELDNIFHIMSIDIKTHSEKVLNHLSELLASLKELKNTDYYLKLLLPEENAKSIIDYTAEILSKYGIKTIYIQPIDSKITKDILDYLYNKYYTNNIEARVIPQTHKILSIP